MAKDLFLSERMEQLQAELLRMYRLLEQADVKPRPALAAGWVDGSEVMRALHISPRTLQTLRSNGTLGYTTLGKKFYYKLEEIEELLRNNYVMYRLSARGKREPAPAEKGGRP